jgi:hypothetical protein
MDIRLLEYFSASNREFRLPTNIKKVSKWKVIFEFIQSNFNLLFIKMTDVILFFRLNYNVLNAFNSI